MADQPYDEIGYWSEVKLDIIREYASAYSTIMNKQAAIRRYVYIDAFAGYGVHLSATTGQYVSGSPTNALWVDPPFSEFHFIDLDDERIESLQTIAANRPEVNIYHGDCNDVLLSDVFPRCRYDDFARGLCLLDPYKLNVNWKVLETAGRMRSIEVFYNFMIMDANRNVLWRDPDKVAQSQIDRMDLVWGDDSWHEVVYPKQRGLFADFEIVEKASNETLAQAFQKRLQKVAGFSYVPDPLPMRNSTGATIYYLFFASHNEKGAKIVSDIFKKHKPRT